LRFPLFPFIASAIAASVAPAALAAGSTQPVLIIKDHKFEPAELHVPAGKRITVTVDNRDGTPEEVESKTLRIEKIVPAGSKGILRFGPLGAGTYTFFGDFHPDTAQGKVIAE
jgi:plastocyanin